MSVVQQRDASGHKLRHIHLKSRHIVFRHRHDDEMQRGLLRLVKFRNGNDIPGEVDEKGILHDIEIGQVDSNPYLAGNTEKDQKSVKPARMLKHIQILVILHVNNADIIPDIYTVRGWEQLAELRQADSVDIRCHHNNSNLT